MSGHTFFKEQTRYNQRMEETQTGAVTTIETPEQTAAYWERCREMDSYEREYEAEREYRHGED